MRAHVNSQMVGPRERLATRLALEAGGRATDHRAAGRASANRVVALPALASHHTGMFGHASNRRRVGSATTTSSG
jgi:hypothetical protein